MFARAPSEATSADAYALPQAVEQNLSVTRVRVFDRVRIDSENPEGRTKVLVCVKDVGHTSVPAPEREVLTSMLELEVRPVSGSRCMPASSS